MIVRFFFALACLVCAGVTARAGECACCQHCGCNCECRKVCRCVPDVKKVPKTTYTCECEDFCVPGPSHREVVCDECGNKHHVYTPTCAHVRTRKKLVKHETMEEKKTYKWVVEYVCERCAACEECQPATEPCDESSSRRGTGVQQTSYGQPAGGPAPAAQPSSAAPADLKSQVKRLFTLGRDEAAR